MSGDRKDKARRNLKKLGILFLNFVILYALLRLIIAFGERYQNVWIYYIGTSLYIVSACVLFLAFFFLNGFTFSNADRTADELPAKWDDEKKRKFLEAQPERRAKAKRLLYVFLPLVISLFISYIELIIIG